MSFFHSLTPDQQRLILDYKGPDSLLPLHKLHAKLMAFDKRTERLVLSVPVEFNLAYVLADVKMVDVYMEGEYPLTPEQAQRLVPWLDVSMYDCFVAGCYP